MGIADTLLQNIREVQTAGAERESMVIRLTGAEYAQLKHEMAACGWCRQESEQSHSFAGIPIMLLH